MATVASDCLGLNPVLTLGKSDNLSYPCFLIYKTRMVTVAPWYIGKIESDHVKCAAQCLVHGEHTGNVVVIRQNLRNLGHSKLRDCTLMRNSPLERPLASNSTT